MELHEYPRPANDTGIGVHWTVGFASAVGIARIRDFWIPEMKAMGVKWVKIFNHDGAMDFVELLLAEGMMPIVRLFKASPNPSTLDVREVVHLDAFLRAGVRYFEFNSEPDRDAEWKGGRLPANGLDLVVENTIANLDIILERGGMPGIPAVSNGNRWDLVGKIVARGRKDIFNGPVWQAIHNYTLNRPLDYPYDIGNQEGAAYTQRFYQAVAAEQWGEDAWRGRTLAEVNRLRLDRSSPSATIMDDNACWLAYEFFDARIRRHLGRSLPILATECGYLVGEDIDPRYPATTPDLHMAQTLEACRVMMGSSQRFQSAPDYYFCAAFWLIANALLGNNSRWCEHHAWYSDRWPAKQLPIVAALKAEPKVIRRWQSSGEVGARSILHGAVLHAGDRRILILEQNGKEVTRVTLDANSRYAFPELLPGNYTLRVANTKVETAVSLAPGQEELLLNLDLSAAAPENSASAIVGKVAGGAGAVVMLLRSSDGEEWVTMARDDGAFRFVDLPPGVYALRVQGNGSRVEGVTLDGRNQREVELAVAGWGHTVRMYEEAGRGGAIRCSAAGHADLRVQVHTGGWSSEPVRTGSAPHLGPFACEIAPLEPGHYMVVVEGLTDAEGRPLKLEASVNVDRRAIPFVEFVYHEAPQAELPSRSRIHGRIAGGCEPGRGLHVWLYDPQAGRREQAVAEDCTFAFDGLGAGNYAVEVVGYADIASRSDIALDGENTVYVELYVPVAPVVEPEPESPAGESVIRAATPDAAGKLAKLVDSVGNELRQKVETDHSVRFERLAAGVYTLTVEGGYEQTDLEVDGRRGVEVIFMPLVSQWEVTVNPAGSMPGYSVVRVEVDGMRGLPVYIWKDDWEGMMRRTGSKPEYGECSAEFSPLGPGAYMVEPEGLGVWADVQLTGLEVVWIDFRRLAVPSTPNLLQVIEPALAPLPATFGEWDEEGGAAFDPEGEPAEPSPAPAERQAAPPGAAPRASVDAPLRGPRTRECVILAGPLIDLADQVALLRYVAQAQPEIITDVLEAFGADRVLLIEAGDREAAAGLEARLQAFGAAVERITGSLAARFGDNRESDI